MIKGSDKLDVAAEELITTIFRTIAEETDFTLSGDCTAIAPSVEIIYFMEMPKIQ